MKKRNGFTLIELIVTLAVVAIMAAIAVPNMMEMVRNERLVSITNEFISNLNYARSEAIKRDTTIDVTATGTGGDWGSGVTVTLNNAAKTPLRKMSALPSNFTLVSVNSNTQLQYLPSGFSNIADSYNLCSTVADRPGNTIQVSLTGHVSVQPITASSGVCP